MRRPLFRFAIATVLAPTFLLAAAPPTSQTGVASVVVANGSCPVSFDVHRNSPGLVANIDHPNRHRGSQRIFFTLAPADDRTVQSIDLVVHAVSARSGLYPANLAAGQTPDIDREFTLTAPNNIGLHGRNLWVDRVGGILSVDLTSIAYTDGSTWHTSQASICHAVPNGFTLVGAAASR